MPTYLELSGLQEVADALGKAPQHLEQAFDAVRYEFLANAQTIIEETLIQAAAEAGPDAFPPEYVGPMLDAAKGVLISISMNEIVLDLDVMGNFSDLADGYHYGAAIADGGRVTLPWRGGAGDAGLKNTVDERYEFWLSMKEGLSYKGIDTTGLWNETIQARLNAWGTKAPQWLLLQYGQEEWEPLIAPSAIIETLDERLSVLFYNLLSDAVDRIVDEINYSTSYTIPAGASYVPSGRGSRLRSRTTGRFIKGG